MSAMPTGDVFWRWQGWAGGSGMGGAVMVLIALWERAFPIRVMDKKMYFSIVIGAFLFGAFFLAWRDKHRALIETKAQLSQALQENYPELQGEIDQVVFGEFAETGNSKLRYKRIPMAVLVVSIRNLRAPTIVQNYRCVATTPENMVFQGKPQVIPDSFSLNMEEGGQLRPYGRTDALYEKTAEHPIEKGAMRRGVLFYLFPESAKRFEAGTRLEVSFEDVTGKSYTASFTPNHKSDLLHYPGIVGPNKH